VTAATTRLGQNGTGQGALTLAGTASARGQLTTGQVVRGSGTGSLSFNGGLLRATSDGADCDAPRLGLHHNESIQAVAYSIKTDSYRQLAMDSRPEIVMGHS
jgi:ribonuclease HI